ncbi:TPA: hypothetical protein ACW45H_005714 [Salmonella enterica subsp. enterica serovar Newport]
MNLDEISSIFDIEEKGRAYADFLRSVNRIPSRFNFAGYVIQNCFTEEFLFGVSFLSTDATCCVWGTLPDLAQCFDSFADVTDVFFNLSDDDEDVNIAFLFESDKGYFVAAFEDKPRRG